MKRPVLLAALVAHLFVTGCTGAPKQSPLLGPNDDPDELAAAIIRRGHGEVPRLRPAAAAIARPGAEAANGGTLQRALG